MYSVSLITFIFIETSPEVVIITDQIQLGYFRTKFTLILYFYTRAHAIVDTIALGVFIYLNDMFKKKKKQHVSVFKCSFILK